MLKLGFLKKIFISLFIACITLITLEVPFRIYDYGFKYKDLKYKISHGITNIPFEEIQTYLFKTGKCVRDAKLIWRYTKRTESYEFNSLGIRTINSKEPCRLKAKNIYRIIVLGGSHPFGMGVDYNETYAQQLERIFGGNRQKWAKGVEVINAAVPGYSTLQVLIFLKFYMLGFNPDLVIIDAGNNDGILLTADYPWRDSQAVKINPVLCRAINIAEKSSFFWYYRIFISKIINRINGGSRKFDNKLATRVGKEENLQNLEEIKRLAGESHFKVVFLSQMCLDKENHLKRGFGAAVEPFLDIYSHFKEKQDISEYFIDSIHGSAKGHRAIAEIIYRYLVSSKIIQSSPGVEGNRKGKWQICKIQDRFL